LTIRDALLLEGASARPASDRCREHTACLFLVPVTAAVTAACYACAHYFSRRSIDLLIRDLTAAPKMRRPGRNLTRKGTRDDQD
jgi:hypothetical protein